jgi:tetratricopeptide (TPR) repeat protein
VIAVSGRTLAALGAGALVLVLLVGLGWFWYSTEQRRALEAYATAASRVRAAQASQAKPEDRAAAVRELETALTRFSSSGAAAPAAYQLASLRYDAGDYAAARAAYEIVLARGARNTLRTLAQSGVGYTWEAQGDYAKAIDAYRGALGSLGPKDFYYESLLVDLGRSQELAGKKAEAVETYRRFLKELPQARRADDVRARLLSLGASS